MTEDDARLRDEEVADAAGVDVDRVARWRDLGLISGSRACEDWEALERARLVAFAEERGVPVETIARANDEQHDLLGRFVALAGTRRRCGSSLTDAARAVDLDTELAEQAWAASGLSDQSEVFDDDVVLLETVQTAIAVGLPDGALLQLLRVYADALGRVADAESRLFHLHVHDQLRRQGLEAGEIADATRPLTDALTELIEPTVLYFHRKAWERAAREDLLLHLREDGDPETGVGEIPITVLFVDLASFTPFAEAAGDAAAVSLLDRFSAIARDAATAHHGRVVKQIGDEFMIVFDEPADAVGCGLQLQATATREQDLLGVRIGAHTGTAVYREGDYLGGTVNIAARVTAEARRGEILLTSEVRDRASSGGVVFRSTGRHQLKGLDEPVELYAATAT